MMKFAKFLIITFALTACSGSEKLSFSCKPSTRISKYTSLKGSNFTYQFDSKSSSMIMFSDDRLDPDHDPRDPTDLDISYDNNTMMFAYSILLDGNMYKKQRWSNEHLSCHRLKLSGKTIFVRCKNSGYKSETDFTYSKAQGITSMEIVCSDCNPQDKQVLTSKYGIGKSCD